MIDRIYAIKDPVERLKVIHLLQAFITTELRKAKRDAAYSSRKTYTSTEIENKTGIYRKDIDYLVRCYITDNPAAPVPKHMKKSIKASVNLTSINDRNDRTIWKQMDKLTEPIDGDELRVMPLLDDPPIDE